MFREAWTAIVDFLLISCRRAGVRTAANGSKTAVAYFGNCPNLDRIFVKSSPIRSERALHPHLILCNVVFSPRSGCWRYGHHLASQFHLVFILPRCTYGHQTRDQVQPLVVTPGKDFNTKFGNFRQADFVGVPYGSKVPSRSGRGFIHILRPTPELWTIALPHRTQILYLADIAFITSYLNIRKGSRVIEAGKSIANVRLTCDVCAFGMER